MKIFNFYHELVRRNRLLAYVGLTHLLLFFLFAGLSWIDPRTITGINAWIKPMKFALSIWIYIWTLGWYLYYLPDSRLWVRIISIGVAVTMLIEMLCIAGQAARGVRSHFNTDTTFDAIVFSVMGNMILINTVLVIIATVLFFVKKPDITPAYRLAIRLGLLLFLLASGVGGIMIRHMSHSVDVADGGAGLPFVNWSVEGGDLRIAHFIGIHALQIIPFFAYRIERKSISFSKAWIWVFTALYVGLTVFLFWQAMAGKPFINRLT